MLTATSLFTQPYFYKIFWINIIPIFPHFAFVKHHRAIPVGTDTKPTAGN